MTQQLAIDREKAAVLIMDFQQRIVNNVASDPEAVVQKASQVLQGARQRDSCHLCCPSRRRATRIRPGRGNPPGSNTRDW